MLVCNRSKLIDIITALALVMVFFFCALFARTDGCYWGDDFAAYISEGISIADGTFDRQTELNTLMHPSPLPDEAVGKPLVYVWGYPLLLSAVYRAVGFDRVDYSNIADFKLPTVICFALTAGILFLFFRRRFDYKLSLLLAFLFCSCAEFYTFINTLYSDLVFLFFSVLSLYTVELYTDSSGGKRHILFGILLGAALWYTYEVRLNGIAIVMACIAAHTFFIVKNKVYVRFKGILIELIPYIVFFVLRLASEKLLASPTSNISDIQDCTLSMLIANLRTYLDIILSFFDQIWNNLLISPLYSVLRRFIEISFDDLYLFRRIFTAASFAIAVLGMLSCCIRKNTHLTLLVLLYIIAASVLPYTQGMRYLYPILPVILLFCGYGIQCLIVKFSFDSKLAGTVITVLCCVMCMYRTVSRDISVQRGETEETVIADITDIYMQNAYSPAAVEVYGFIRENTPEDCTLAFFTPRCLYLNTERFSIRPDVNGHSIDEADYCLDYLLTGKYNITPELGDNFESIFANEEFVFYKRIDKEQTDSQ